MPADPDPVLQELVSNALLRFEANLDAALPRAAQQLRQHLQRVPTKPEHFFAARNFPHFLLPWWFSPAAEREADVEFQTDLMYSSISGYYAIRLCDNIADNDSPPALRSLAPCTLYFDSEAIAPYRTYFPTTHAFWKSFESFLAGQAEASAADSLLEDVDAESFESLSSKKFTGTKIPMSAVRWRYPCLESSFDQWLQFIDCLGSFAQFNNDFFDWRHDSQHGITTYVTSESRRRAPGESVATWFLKEGFDWGVEALKWRFDDVTLQGRGLGNEAVQDWLTARGRTLEDDIGKLRSGLILLKTLGKIISGQQP
jgi:hypothetical protein